MMWGLIGLLWGSRRVLSLQRQGTRGTVACASGCVRQRDEITSEETARPVLRGTTMQAGTLPTLDPQQTSTVGGKRPRRRNFLRDLKVVVLKQASKRQR